MKYFTYLTLLLLTFFPFKSAFNQNGTESIKLNQTGFYPNGKKIAIITGKVNTTDFFITSTNQRDTFYRGTLTSEKTSPFSSTTCRTADFSMLNKSGSYQVVIPQLGHSYNFIINEDVNRKNAVAAIKGYYYQRCSIPLEEKYAGKWHRSAGHPDSIVYVHPSAASPESPSGSVISTPGGWYDAGDYNKYIVNSGISMGTLLSAYEDYPVYFKSLHTNIPESGNGIPDILNECIYNLRWMLSMQDPNDGGVYNKCTNAAFDGMVMPGITTKQRYVVQKGTAATLDFIAVTAQASRILKTFGKQLPGLSDSCIHAATFAWQWALKNPELFYDQNAINKLFEPKITTGAYGDNNLNDEWFWAACEMFTTTHNTEYYPLILQKLSPAFSVPGWNNVAMPGMYSLIRNKSSLPPVATSLVKKISLHLTLFADSLITNTKSVFNTLIGQGPKDFIWGSNAVAANQSIVLLNAYKISTDKKYLEYALSNLDYLLGRNATGFCFLTGSGSRSTMHPHHRQSVSDGVTEPVPGLLAGGPNPGKQDGAVYEYSDPETAYTDKSEAYACNEIAINWNAPFVYLVCAMEALQKQL